ncbi:protein kinase [Kibdelosporangium persicum]|uniref:non-specific serine/threonine protein kinase n=1 Tax=Kibdelosporangium persicum TaxID=2698649 RepID=A0ABX2FBK6_9PSEU|nr:protein kinase [Kibdelosporangium persicum]NRN68751.1 Serine/threonine-protein kinase PknK [Kibdelosporangium persicum]
MTPDDGPQFTLPGYSGLVEVAKGGDSVVYRARQEGLDRDVAVKVILVDDAATAARFQRELEITVRLGRQHPNIVTVIDTGTVGEGKPCLVMEYYDLGSLHDRLRERGAFAVEDVVAVGTVVADALAFAHAQGVLHRDVKPQNILMLPTSYVLADFGLARGIDAGHSVSLERFSYRHAAPQILDGEPPTVADDVYSLGSTLYTLLDGRPPFAAEDPDSDTALSYIRRVRSDRHRPLSRGDVPAELASIVDRCLSKERADRFPDAASVRAALAAVTTDAQAWAPRATGGTRATGDIAARLAGTAVVRDRTAESFDAPKPPEPVRTVRPIATSALAHLDSGVPAQASEEATGSGKDLVLDEPAAPPEDTIEKHRPWRRIALLGATAVVVGTVIGVLMALLRDSAPTRRPAPLDGGVSVPTYTGPEPGRTGLPEVDTSDPKLSPAIVGLEDRSTSVVLRWTDPTDRTGTFVVTRRAGDTYEVVARVSQGTTQFTVEGLDPAARQYCFQVVAIVDSGRRGASPERCTGMRG